jgi:hypothetical protein
MIDSEKRFDTLKVMDIPSHNDDPKDNPLLGLFRDDNDVDDFLIGLNQEVEEL